MCGGECAMKETSQGGAVQIFASISGMLDLSRDEQWSGVKSHFSIEVISSRSVHHQSGGNL